MLRSFLDFSVEFIELKVVSSNINLCLATVKNIYTRRRILHCSLFLWKSISDDMELWMNRVCLDCSTQ
jgi:hypothetical protein